MIPTKQLSPDATGRHVRNTGAVLVLMLLTAWMLVTWPELTHWPESTSPEGLQSRQEQEDITFLLVRDKVQLVIRVLMSPWLLVSLGLLIAIRCGSFDLSPWAVMWLSGVMAAWQVGQGASGPEAARTAGAVALAAGLIVGAAGMWHRQLGLLASVAVALAALAWAQHLAGGQSLEAELLGQATRDSLLPARDNGQDPNLLAALLGISAVRLLMVGLVYCACLLVLMLVNVWSRHHDPSAQEQNSQWQVRWKPRLMRLAGHVLCSLLAGLGGIAWLLEHGRVEAPRQVIGDLRVLAAPILAGGFVLMGRGRMLSAAALLPLALLVATRWRQQVWPIYAGGMELQLLVLLGMVLAIHAALASFAWRGIGLTAMRVGALVLSLAGPLCLLAASQIPTGPAIDRLRWLGLAFSAAGLVCILAAAVFASSRGARTFPCVD